VEPIQALRDERFQIVPNPATRLFSIIAKQATTTTASYVVRNLNGALLLSGELDYEGRASVDLASFPPGIYLVSVNDGGIWEHHKLIVVGR
jgi:hypothetical protein